MKIAFSFKVFLSIILLVIILGLFYWSFVIDDIIVKNYQTFYNSRLDGQIEYLSIKHHGVSLKLLEDKTQYVFYPRVDDQLNHGKIFTAFAKKGDRVYKRAFGDSLFLFKGDKKYVYLFADRP